MTDPLEHFGLERSPFADEPHAGGLIGTRALRRLVARIQAALRDGKARIGVCGVPGIGKSSLASALPKLFAGNTRVATLLDPGREAWPQIRVALARDWQLTGERLSRASLLEAARSHRLVLVIDQAEEAPESLLGHLDALQAIRDEDGAPVVTTILFVRSSDEEIAPPPLALAWLERSEAPRLPFEPLAPDSVADYIERRLRCAGYRGSPLFTPRAALAIHAETAGVPGAVSRLCDQLLAEAATRRLRSIDEPFVRTRQQTPRALVALASHDVDTAWDDADHHPRETVASERLIEQAIGSPGEAVVSDPELEAFLSAPPSEAELRAIRGGVVRRSLRPLALAAGAVLLGGALLALLLGGDPPGSAPSAAIDPRSVPRPGIPVDGSGTMPADPGLPVLGRIRGPAPPPADTTPARNPRATPPPSRTGEAMAGSGTPLVPAGELVDDGAPAANGRVTDEGAEESEAPDFRPPDLVAPARLDDSDL